MQYTGARIVIECLKEQGVDTVFGFPGGKIIRIYDELYKNQDAIRHILTAHEQGASHAADGYSRTSGKVGVVFATSGPGATNLVTGIANAYMDSIPMIAITCNVPSHLLGKDSFQEVDISGITMSITKHNYIVRDAALLADTIREAFVLAKTGRPGPVLIDIPEEIAVALIDYTPMTQKQCLDKFLYSTRKNGKPVRAARLVKNSQTSAEAISEAAQLISESKRPLLYVGGGVVISDACEELKALAEKCAIPVCVSLMGKSAFPSLHPLCVGMIGMHGTKAANTAANKADLLITIGARFSDRVTSNPKKFAQGGKILHIDIDPAEINKNIPSCHAVVGDVKDVLQRMMPLIKTREKSEWNAQIDEWKKHQPRMYTQKLKLHPKFICEEINHILGDDTIITTEVGQHQMWTAQFYPFSKPHTFITSGGLGAMGFGTGAAMGVQTANPDRYVVHIAGDGSFRMNCNELSTISYYNMPIIIIVMNNGTLGMVRQWQKLFFDGRYSATTLDRPPDFVKLADAYGIRGYRVETDAEFTEAFKKAVAADSSGKRTPALIDCRISIDEMVFPMVPAGKPIDELLLD